MVRKMLGLAQIDRPAVIPAFSQRQSLITLLVRRLLNIFFFLQDTVFKILL